MPWTNPEGDTAHVWTEGHLGNHGQRWLLPNCGGGRALDFDRNDLIRVEERPMSAGTPRTLRDWVLWSEVCRECAELMVEELGLHLAPLQWIP